MEQIAIAGQMKRIPALENAISGGLPPFNDDPNLSYPVSTQNSTMPTIDMHLHEMHADDLGPPLAEQQAKIRSRIMTEERTSR